MSYREVDPKLFSVSEVHRLLLGGVAPRPIALVASMSVEGEVNLSPFSFFNAFGANPPVVAFSPAYRGKDGTPKDTFLNIKEFSEYTISIVTYNMVGQVSLASAPYAKGIDEFVKAGFTKLPSVQVKPPGVAESPFVMECKLLQHIDLGGKAASGNLMIGEVVYFHIKEVVFTDDKIDPHKMDVVARLGYDWYARINGEIFFKLAQPNKAGIGFDQVPEHIRHSSILTGNDLAKLAGVTSLPDRDAISRAWQIRSSQEMRTNFNRAEFYKGINNGNPDEAHDALLPALKNNQFDQELLHQLAKAYLQRNDVSMAWEVLMCEGIQS